MNVDRMAGKSASLTNFEVFRWLQEEELLRKRNAGRSRMGPPNLMTIEFEIFQYLQNTAVAKYPSVEAVQALLTALVPFSLSLLEKRHIVNYAPISIVDLHVFLDKCDERFSNEKQLQILQLIKEHLRPSS